LLSSTIIEEISRHCKSGSLLAFAYFYFDFNDTDTRLNGILRSLITQLSLQFGSTPGALEKLFSENTEGHQPATPEKLVSTLKSIVGSFQTVYIIFDALDEYPKRVELLTLLRDFHNWGLGTLHILATSRNERDIAETLDSLVSHRIPMEGFVDGDIRVYVSHTLDHDLKFQMCSAEEKKMIETTLISGAHGM